MEEGHFTVTAGSRNVVQGQRREAGGLVYVIDDDPALRRILTRLLAQLNRPIKAFASVEDFEATYDPDEVSCLVLDVRMPGKSGLELHRDLLARGQHPPIVFLTSYGDIRMAVEAMRGGAVDFLQKPFRNQELIERVRQALSLAAARHRRALERRAAETRLARVTANEREVIDLAAQGMTNKEIAGRLGVSPQAIDARRSRALRKLDLDNVPQLVRFLETTHRP